MILLHLLACLSAVPAARGDLVSVAVQEAQAYDTVQAQRALQEAHPWLLSVSVDEDAPWVLHVRLSQHAPADALDVLAEDYSLRVTLREPVEVWGYSCAEWMVVKAAVWGAEIENADWSRPVEEIAPEDARVCKGARWVVSGRSGEF